MMSENINELSGALCKVQSELRGAVKDSKNPFFKSTYADLSSVWDACRTLLAKNGLCVIQTTAVKDGNQVLVTTLSHSSGQFIQGEYVLTPVKNDPQSMGSAMTYARRYALSAIVGIVAEDDDGEAAMSRPVNNTVTHIKPAPSQPTFTVSTGIDASMHIITVGKKFKDKKISDCNRRDLENWMTYLDSTGEPLTGKVLEDYSMVKLFLNRQDDFAV